jgi:signal recognition particle subunit SRP54
MKFHVHKAIQFHETLTSRCKYSKSFNDILNFDGVILTKLDGDTRGGADFETVVNKPIKL